MAIGKISNRRWEGEGNDKHQVVHIILLPTFPESKYKDLQPGKQYSTGLGAGATLWAESGQQLEVIEAGGYPYLAAKSLDEGNVFGKATNDDSEAKVWLQKIGNDLLPTNYKGVPLWTGLAQWNLRWEPLKQELDNASHASDAAMAVRKIKETKGLPGLGKEAVSSAAHPVDSAKMTASAGKEAVKEAGKQLKEEAKSFWDDIGPGWKYGAAAFGLVVVAMVISEKVK